jgi:hypothetical protein
MPVVRLKSRRKKAEVFIAHTPADLVDRLVGTFQPALGILDAQALRVFRWDDSSL